MLANLLILASIGVLFTPASASALGARFGDPVAVRGESLRVRVEILDDPGVVARVEIELRADKGAWQTRSASKEGDWWVAKFEASEVWTQAKVQRLEARASVFGFRGGIVLQIGHANPLEFDILTRSAAGARTRALAQDERRLGAEAEDDFVLAGLIGVQGGVSDPARLRVFIGASVPTSKNLSVTLNLTVGPSFSEPSKREAGALVLGVESGIRFRSGPPRNQLWSTFAGPRIGADLRLPGVDGLIGLEAGVQFGLSETAALELGILGSALLVHLADDENNLELGVSGGLRAAIRLGDEA